MSRVSPRILSEYLLRGTLPRRGCLRRNVERPIYASRDLHHDAQVKPALDAVVPFRKELKDKAKQQKAQKAGVGLQPETSKEHHPEWELTVGIEIHAQLNTPRKLFSKAASTISDEPNSHVALFDLAVPGTHPIFQKETLIPAIRAALALNCNVQNVSRFDRKHYFHWDQPAGYQITQYYEPFAKDGHIVLYKHDGIAAEDGEEVRIGIKQIQMEQDTAKTISQPDGRHLLDFNRVGLPLIEIITLPQIHHPSTAAALVRKIQVLLNAADACVLGLESGGLRADVNVSVRKRDDIDVTDLSYAGITNLGQRVEIKNLSSFKSVKDAIIAERDRQIQLLEAGGSIEGETRGWTLGSSETKRLRGKEGEVDYRYMPDPDLAPIFIGSDLVQHLKSTLGTTPEDEVSQLTEEYGLTEKDARSLTLLENGGRVEYFYLVVDELQKLRAQTDDLKVIGAKASNWVLHELGGLLRDDDDTDLLQIRHDGSCVIPAKKLAQLIHYREENFITGKTAKEVLRALLANETSGVDKSIDQMLEEGNLWYKPLSLQEYRDLAESVIEEDVMHSILAGEKGKLMYLVGKMMRAGENGRVEPKECQKMMQTLVEERRRV